MYRFGFLLAAVVLLAGCASQPIRSFDSSQYAPAATPPERGMASWYGPGFNGNKTASGERYNQKDFTAAHRTLPFGTVVRVTNETNGRSVIVEITDRGPWTKGRVIDVSKAAAEVIGLIGPGTAPVQVQVLRPR